jgi:hypothetical protein
MRSTAKTKVREPWASTSAMAAPTVATASTGQLAPNRAENTRAMDKVVPARAGRSRARTWVRQR